MIHPFLMVAPLNVLYILVHLYILVGGRSHKVNKTL